MKRLYSLFLVALMFTGVSGKTVFTGDHAVGSWNAKQLSVGEYPVLGTAGTGDVIAVTISNVNDARITLQTTAYGSLGDDYDEYNCNEGVHYFVLTESAANEVKTNGLNVSGENYTLKKVELLYKKTLWSGELNGLNSNWEQSDALSNSIFSDLVYGVPFGVTVSQSASGYNAAVVRINYESNVFDKSFEKASTKVQQLTASDVKSLQTQTVNIVARYLVITELNTYTQMKQEEGTVAVSIGEDGIATFSYGSNLNFEDTGITPYYASSVSEGTVNLTPMTTTWNWEGYILKGDPGIYYVPTVDDEHAQHPTANYLKQMVYGDIVKASESGDTKFRYIFAKDKLDGTIAFFKLTSPYTLAAHRAYLETETDIKPVTEARVVLRFEDDPTAIGEVKCAAQPVKADNVYYNLNGQRVEKPTKGIYILNGKKVLF